MKLEKRLKSMEKKANRESRREAILRETHEDMRRGKELGEKAERLYDEAMRRRVIPA